MDENVEMAVCEFIALDRLDAGRASQRPNTPRIPAGESYAGSLVFGGEDSAASCSAVAGDQHRRLLKRRSLLQGRCDSDGIRVCPAQFSSAAINRIDRADSLGQRIDGLQVTHHALLVRNRDADPGHRQVARESKEIGQLTRFDQERQVNRIDALGLKGPVVNGRRHRMAHRTGNHTVDLRGGLAFLRLVAAAHQGCRDLAGRRGLRSRDPAAFPCGCPNIGRAKTENGAAARPKNATRCPCLSHSQDHEGRALALRR